MRAHGRPQAGSAANPTTLSSTITSGSSSPMISCSRSSTYFAPSTSAWNVGAMKPASCSIVGSRNTGAVSRMKSFQNCPGTSSSSGGGVSRMSRSSNPCASSVPANDSSTMKTTRWPRRRSTSPMPTQLLVGPYAPSGKNAIVATRAIQPKKRRPDRCYRVANVSVLMRLRLIALRGKKSRPRACIEVRNVREAPPLELVSHAREGHVDRRALAHRERDDDAAAGCGDPRELVEERDHVAERHELERAVFVGKRRRVRDVVVDVA